MKKLSLMLMVLMVFLLTSAIQGSAQTAGGGVEQSPSILLTVKSTKDIVKKAKFYPEVVKTNAKEAECKQ